MQSQVKTYGGRQLWRVYLEMVCETDSWWYADPSNVFDYEMFIGLMILQEANIMFTSSDESNATLNPDSLMRAEMVAEVVGTVLKYGGFRDYSCSAGSGRTCTASLFNFWADHSQVARNLINDYYHLVWDEEQQRSVADMDLSEYAASGPASVGTYYNRQTGNKTPPQLMKILSEARRLGYNAIHNPAYAIPNGPIMYGLNSQWTRKLSSDPYNVPAGRKNGTGRETIYYYTTDGIIFYTASQYGYWRGQLGGIVDNTDPMP
jgi:hypothetical protein